MPNILLINPPFNISKENYDSSVSVGLLSIASYLFSKGINVKIIDAARQQNFLELIKAEAPKFDFAGLSVMTTQISNALEISRMIKEVNNKCKIIWGGSHATFFIRETAAHPLVDIVCYGEGEITTHELLMENDLSKINGIAYKNKDEIIINQPRILHDPSLMPLFNWDLIDADVLKKLQLVPSLTSRGCPHRCTFCINVILKNRWRPRTVRQVLDDLEIIESKDYFKDKKIRFWDENFFVDIKRAQSIIDGMINRGLIIPWETTIRADYLRDGMVDEKFLAKIKESGCYLLSFGAESGSEIILKKIKKDVTAEQILDSARKCLKAGIIPQYSFMIGLPGETKEDMLKTLHLIGQLTHIDSRIQILGPQAFRPYPGSELYAECVAAGWQEPKSTQEWAQLARNELNYLTVKNFPWVRDKDFVESMEMYTRFGAHSISSALSSTIKVNKALKLAFILICQLRWKLKFFAFPIEYKLAKRFIAK
jgi:anaerobic magnesium-protoporphyrin IX monomethyl ester cyclase